MFLTDRSHTHTYTVLVWKINDVPMWVAPFFFSLDRFVSQSNWWLATSRISFLWDVPYWIFFFCRMSDWTWNVSIARWECNFFLLFICITIARTYRHREIQNSKAPYLHKYRLRAHLTMFYTMISCADAQLHIPFEFLMIFSLFPVCSFDIIIVMMIASVTFSLFSS